MSVKFFLSNDKIFVDKHNDDLVLNSLPPKVYKVSHDDMLGFFLTTLQDSFVVPPKMYGSTNSRITKILNTYQSRDSQMGVLLTGSKGTGKTILSEALCNQALQLGIPVVLVSSPFSGTDFFTFMSYLGECVVLFDEFGKVYKDTEETPAQESLLSFLDGTYSTKRLLLFTENQEELINEFLLNRPGRVFYHFKYERVEDAVILEYCQDNNIPQEELDSILDLADQVEGFSFDMLKAVTDEYLRYKQPVVELIKDMNIQIGYLNVIVKVLSATIGDKVAYPSTNIVYADSDDYFSLELYETKEEAAGKDSKSGRFFSAYYNRPAFKKDNMLYFTHSGATVVATVEKIKLDCKAF